MPQRRGLVPVKAVQQHSLSLSFFRDLLGPRFAVLWYTGCNFIALVFCECCVRDTGRALFAFVRPVLDCRTHMWVTELY